MKYSYHAMVERKDRIEKIQAIVGFGQIVKESYRNGAWNCLTDTGVMLIINDTKELLITAYIATYREAVALFNGTKKIPPYLHKKIDYNQSKFTKEGKTYFER